MFYEIGELLIKIIIISLLSYYFGHMGCLTLQEKWIQHEDSEDKSCRTYRISHEGMPFTDVYTVCQKGATTK